MSRLRLTNGKKDYHEHFHFGTMAIPLAFINGLYLGGYALQKIRQHYEGEPMD